MSFVLSLYPLDEMINCLELFIYTGLWDIDFDIFKQNIDKNFKKVIFDYHPDKIKNLDPLQSLVSKEIYDILLKYRSYNSNENYTEESLKQLHRDLMNIRVFSNIKVKLMKKYIEENPNLKKYFQEYIEKLQEEENKKTRIELKKRKEQNRMKELERELTKKRHRNEELYKEKIEEIRSTIHKDSNKSPKKLWSSPKRSKPWFW